MVGYFSMTHQKRQYSRRLQDSGSIACLSDFQRAALYRRHTRRSELCADQSKRLSPLPDSDFKVLLWAQFTGHDFDH